MARITCWGEKEPSRGGGRILEEIRDSTVAKAWMGVQEGCPPRDVEGALFRWAAKPVGYQDEYQWEY